MKKETLRKIVHITLKLITRSEYAGLENIPARGPAIFATNHMSRVDIALLFDNPVRPDITALVADKYQGSGFIRWFTRTAEGIWLDRSKADFAAFRQSAEVLKAGLVLGIAPEGTRSDSGELLEGKGGTALLAMRLGVPVIPASIAGTDTAVADFKRLRRPRLIVTYGRALTPPPLPRENRDQAVADFTEEIMCQVAANLPERYHGFYRGRPRLLEILSQRAAG
jgi:1-acyl-sn-glycerol-3-phosphate acyltransferase